MGAAVLPAERASASPYLVIPAPEVAEASAAYRYANMTGAEALAELDKRKVPYKKADPIDGVVSPVRLTGKLHGVWIHSSIPESQRATSIYEVLDARLALALDDFAKVLERHDIEEVVHYSLYRPNVPREDADVKEEAAHTHTEPAALPAASPSTGAGKPALATAAGAGKPGAIATAKTHPTASAGKPGHAAIAKPAAAKGKPAAPVKPAANAAPAKSSLPPLPAKALPSLPAKGGGAAHGAKQKTPLVVDKPALPAARRSATAQKNTLPARARVATPHKADAKAPLPAPQKASSAGKFEPKAPAASAAKTPVGAPLATSAKNAPAAPVSRQTWAPPGTRHPAGLAIDVALLKKRDGEWISVARHFQGKIGAKTCGDGVRTADTPEARELRSIVCEANDQGVFTYVLTPNFNAAHYDHFHMEIKPAVKWFLYQ